MNKRQRKKNHLGEFQVLITPIRTTFAENLSDDEWGSFVDRLADFGAVIGLRFGLATGDDRVVKTFWEHPAREKTAPTALALHIAASRPEVVVEIAEPVDAHHEPRGGYPDETWRPILEAVSGR